jgi:hypothetical protein
MGDVRNNGRIGLTGTLIEGSSGLKHRNLQDAGRAAMRIIVKCHRLGSNLQILLAKRHLVSGSLKFRAIYLVADLVSHTLFADLLAAKSKRFAADAACGDLRQMDGNFCPRRRRKP